MTRVPGDVQEAREAFGARLRELRQRASLTGRALANRTGMHFTKISRVEHGKQGLTDDEIRAWAAVCGVADQVPDLIAIARSVDSLYREWRRQMQTGLRLVQEAAVRRYQGCRLLRIYERTVLPGLLQTAAYSNESMTQWVRLMGVPDDHHAATDARLASQKVLRSGPVQRFVFLLEEQALRTRFGTPEVMVEQLDHLLSLLALPRVSIGIIPAISARSFVSQVPFWIWDDTKVIVETISAELEITRKDEVAIYAAAFDLLRQSALYGSRAQALVVAAREEFRRLIGNSG